MTGGSIAALRSPGKDVQELHDFAVSVVERINKKYGAEGYQPVVWLERSVPLYERIALYSVADVAVVAATRDGMNLVPYEYIVSRQGQPVHFLTSVPQHTLLTALLHDHHSEGCPYCLQQAVN